jgi:hypothetical protein
VRQLRIKVKNISIYFDIKGIVNKEFIVASEAVNSTCYSDVLRRLHEKEGEDFALNFGNKRTGCFITTKHNFTLSFFTRDFFTIEKD